MEWIPNTVDALARLYHETGTGGFVAMGTILAVLILVFALWRHTGKLIDLGNNFFAHQAIKAQDDKVSAAKMLDKLESISKSNTQIAERVDKLPSDRPECRAMNNDQMIAVLKTMFDNKGIMLTEAEIGMLLKHREELHSKMAQTTMDAPVQVGKVKLRD